MQTNSRWHRGVHGFVARPIIGKRPHKPHSKCIDPHFVDENKVRLTKQEVMMIKDYDSRTLTLMGIRRRYLHVTKGYREIAA